MSTTQQTRVISNTMPLTYMHGNINAYNIHREAHAPK